MFLSFEHRNGRKWEIIGGKDQRIKGSPWDIVGDGRWDWRRLENNRKSTLGVWSFTIWKPVDDDMASNTKGEWKIPGCQWRLLTLWSSDQTSKKTALPECPFQTCDSWAQFRKSGWEERDSLASSLWKITLEGVRPATSFLKDSHTYHNHDLLHHHDTLRRTPRSFSLIFSLSIIESFLILFDWLWSLIYLIDFEIDIWDKHLCHRYGVSLILWLILWLIFSLIFSLIFLSSHKYWVVSSIISLVIVSLIFSLIFRLWVLDSTFLDSSIV